MWIITGRPSGSDGLRAAQHLDVVVAGDRGRQARFDADDEVAIALDRGARGAHVGERQVLRVALGDDAFAAHVHEYAPALRRGARHG